MSWLRRTKKANYTCIPEWRLKKLVQQNALTESQNFIVIHWPGSFLKIYAWRKKRGSADHLHSLIFCVELGAFFETFSSRRLAELLRRSVILIYHYSALKCINLAADIGHFKDHMHQIWVIGIHSCFEPKCFAHFTHSAVGAQYFAFNDGKAVFFCIAQD